MPTILRIRGYRFFFFSNERGERPHIHIESDKQYAKFWLEPVELSRSIGYNTVELARLEKIVIDHKMQLLERWHEYFTR
jgi:hypothetical protein